jgi:CubicO group peptidase (beta-lactamase class C family)
MVIEADMAGNYGLFLRLGNDTRLVKIGLLYLHKGNWNGEQILEESWVKYVQLPPQRQRCLWGAVLVKRVVSFQMRQGICFIVAVSRTDGSDHSIIGFGYRTHGLKRRS